MRAGSVRVDAAHADYMRRLLTTGAVIIPTRQSNRLAGCIARSNIDVFFGRGYNGYTGLILTSPVRLRKEINLNGGTYFDIFFNPW